VIGPAGTLRLIVCSALGVIGILGFILAWRGKRVGDARFCRKCRYELTGLPDEVATCPECGRSLNEPRAIRIGARRKRRWLGAASLLLLLIAMAGVGVFSTGLGERLIRGLPPSALMTLAERGSDVAVDELQQRLDQGELDAAVVSELADATIRRQGDFSRPFDPEWEAMLGELLSRRLLSDEQLVRCVRNAVRFDIVVRERMHAEKQFSHEIDQVAQRFPRVAGFNGTTIYIEYRLTSLTMDGEDLIDLRWLRTSSVTLVDSGGSSIVTSPIAFTPDPGVHTVRSFVLVRLLDPSTGPPREGGAALDEWTVERTQRVTVVPEVERIVRPIDSPSAQENIRSSLAISHLSVPKTVPQRGGRMVIAGKLYSTDRTTPIAFDVFAILPDGTKIRAGRCVDWPNEIDEIDHFHINEWNLDPDEPHPVRVDWPATVDVVLIPNFEEAYRHPKIDAIYGGEVRFRDVPVERVDSLEGLWWGATEVDQLIKPASDP
jgi:hypothetical protein